MTTTTAVRRPSIMSRRLATPSASPPKFVAASSADFALQSTSPSINAGTSVGAPATSIVFDRRALLTTTVNQPVSWYRYAPDYAYIASRGEVRNLFSSVSRPQGGAFDQGAYEYTATAR